MPIYDLGYRHWEGEIQSHARRWWIISRRGISLLVKNKKFTILLILALIPFLVHAVILYAFFFSSSLNIRIPFLNLDGRFYFRFLQIQAFPIFLMMLYAGAGLIANDLKQNALQIYFSKPITRLDYILGKLGVLGFFTLAITLAPGLLLFILHMSFANDLKVLQESLWLAGSITVFSLFLAGVNSLAMLALSSLTRSQRFASLNFFALFIFTEALFGILKAITRDTRLGVVSMQTNFWRIGEALFGMTTRFNIAAWESFLVLLMLMAACAAILVWRIRPVEVIK